MISEGIVEQHIHGAFGIDFMTCTLEELVEVSQKLVLYGVTAFFPTIMTDDVNVIKERISIVKQAMKIGIPKSAQIAGIHLEGPFINQEKSGIHPPKFIQPLDINIFKQIEDETIKIVTLAPELDCNGEFIDYLKSKDIKVSAGHCLTPDLSKVNQVTHLYNAMGTFNHKKSSTAVSALIDENLYTELIGDSIHVCDDVLKLTFKQKKLDRILLISDALPLSHSTKKSCEFALQTIYNENGKLVNSEGTIAGSSMLLCDIVENLVNKGLLNFKEAIKVVSTNQLKYHNITNRLKVYWNKNNKIKKIDFLPEI